MLPIRTTAVGKDRAVKVTKKNIFDVVDWITKFGGEATAILDTKINKDGVQNLNDRVKVKVKGKGLRVARIGDLVVKHVEDKVASFYVVAGA